MDESALVAVYERYHQQLYRFCFAIVGNAEDAQDALQSAMVKALRALPGERRQIELKPWLYRIAHNESIDLLRRRRNEVQIDPELLVSPSDPQETIATRERLRRLLTDLASLPERQRETLVMRELADLSFAEIAAALGTSPEVARQTLYEARLSLRQLEAGREMGCDEVMRQISDGDRRVLRGREVRAHLRACAECHAFREAIEGRQHDLAAITPLPAVAVAGILQSLLAGAGAGAGVAGAGAAGTVGAGAGKMLATSAIVKSVATVAVVAVVGVGAADRGGLIDAGLPGGNGQAKEKAEEPTSAPAPSAKSQAAAVRRKRLASARALAGGEVAGKVKQSARAHQPRAETPPTSALPSTGAESPSTAAESLPAAASHGQEVAASHGGGRAHGQSRSQAKGNPDQPEAGGGHGPSHSQSPANPKPAASKPKSEPPASPPGQVGPDVSPEPSLKPSQSPKSQGTTGAAGNP